MASPQLLEGIGGIPGFKLKRAGGTNLPFTFGSTVNMGGVVTGTPAVLASAATVAFAPTTAVTQHTPTQAETINFAASGAAGTEIWFEVITSGVSAFVLTFGTNTKTTGTLSTGTTTAKVFIVNFISDGTNWVEVARTTAM